MGRVGSASTRVIATCVLHVHPRWSVDAPTPETIEPQFVHPVGSLSRPILARSYGGNLLVVQKRGLQGVTSNKRGSARSASLGVIGRACIVPADPQSSSFGQVRNVQELMGFYWLPEDAPEGLVRIVVESVATPGGNVKPEKFPVTVEWSADAGPATGSVQLAAGEYAEWDHRGEYSAVRWSSARLLEDVLKTTISLFGSGDESRAMIKSSDGYQSVCSSKEALTRALDNPAGVRFLRINYDTLDLAFTWGPPAVESPDSALEPIHEAAVLFRRGVGDPYALAALRETGSDAVQNAYSSLEPRISG